MAPKKQPLKRPAAAAGRGSGARSRTPRGAKIPDEFRGLRAYVVNLERRPDRWTRVSKMLQKETPWLDFEQFKASDGTQNPIPEEEVTATWNTSCNSYYADYFEWVFEDGTPWKWAADTGDDDEEWTFEENLVNDEEWSFIHHASEKIIRTATVTKKATGEKFKLRLAFSEKYKEPGQVMKMSGGERGCAHSHLRLWRVAAERATSTLVLEDDVQMVFERSGGGKAKGKVFTERLGQALKNAPSDFDVIYLGWSGWRGGNYRLKQTEDPQEAESQRRKQYMRKAEYVWTTVAYVISPAGAKKLLAAAKPLNQPVDNFMAWEASQGRLNAWVALDEGDHDGTWAGGIVDQFDFQGDSDIKKSDGGHQKDDAAEFAVEQ